MSTCKVLPKWKTAKKETLNYEIRIYDLYINFI